MTDIDRTKLVERAKLAEQAERYDDMAKVRIILCISLREYDLRYNPNLAPNRP